MRYLFTTLPTDDLGLLARSLPIADQLRARGHEVVFSSPAAAPSRVIADAGFDNRIPPHPIYEFVGGGGWSDMFRVLRTRRWRRYGTALAFLRELAAARPRLYPPPTTEVWNTDHAAATMGLLNDGFVRANVDALRRLVDRERPDVVVDFWNPLAVVAARSLDVPVATVIQADAHPSSRGFIWWKPMPASVPSPVPAVNRVLGDLGMAPISSLADLSIGDRTLVVGIPETDPLPDSADVYYVGALLWQPSYAELPPSVGSLSGDRPLVWVYSGNPAYGRRDRTLDSQVVIEASIAALATLEVDVVLATGHHPLPARMSVMPPNFVHEHYVPGLKMAQRSDVLIHHGGYGSCQTALWAGRPSVIIPTYSERESNARRMEDAGAAVRVPVTMTPEDKHVDVSSLRAAVERALSDMALSARAAELGKKLREAGGAASAADLIEGLNR